MGARALREARLRAGLTQQALACLASVERTSLTHLERGRRVPTFAVARRLAAALGCDAADLWPEAFAATSDEPPARSLRLARMLSLAEVAAAAGVSRRAVRRADDGGRVTPANAKALADFYGVDVFDLQPPLPITEAVA